MAGASEDDLFGEDDFDVATFDAVLANAARPSRPAPAPAASGSKQLKQQTLFGTVLAPPPPPSRPGPSRVAELGTSSSAAAAAVQQQAKTRASKKWDRARFAQGLPRTGGARGKGKGKAKASSSSWGAAADDDDDEVLDDEGEDVDHELLASLAAQTVGPPPAMKLRCDESEVKTWVYSANKPKRKYQYDIVHRALYNNCLVSLPTGLGKTFIAAVVMLNFYRWYPKGKVLFLAPTRPLVQQQIEACHSIAGIPSRDCVALTGMVPAPRRALAWSSKRVIFSTPQTVENDLRRGRLDPLDVVCCVVDEAHRATGGYAYCEVVRILMQFNSHFRVLALTATPGNDAERVQEVVDSLHIGHIEVRTEDAMDVKPYLRQKQIVLEPIGLTPELESVRDRWASLMRPLISQVDFMLYGTKEPAFLSYYSIQQMQGRVPKEKGWLRPTIAVLAKMTLAMARLLEYSITVGAERMADLRAERSQVAKKVVDQQAYRDLIRDLEKMRAGPGYSAHPKMDKMKALILEYLVEAKDAGKEPRLMVFCHFREVVDDIVTFLNQEGPLVRASAFVGQSKDSKGHSGMNQKAQQACIKRFKANEFNVLVATSIGEEGLDIGALDCILCYDAQSSPLRTLQRIGRTGRLDDGKVIVLMAEGREERNWDKAKDKYEHVQNALVSGKMFELFDDCERLVPPGVKPACDERQIPVQEYIADQVEIAEAERDRDRAAKKAAKATKRKRDGVEDVPADALKGFTSAKNARGPRSRDESLAERAGAAVLTGEEYEAHLASWGRSTSLALAPPAIDLDSPLHGVVYVETTSKLGRATGATRKLTPSARQAAIFAEAEGWTTDEAKYDAWKARAGELWDEDNVVWWANENPGTGVRRPFEPCEEARNPLRRRFRKLKAPEPTPLSGLAKELWGDEAQRSRSQETTRRDRGAGSGQAEVESADAAAKGLPPDPISRPGPPPSSPLPDFDVVSDRVSPRRKSTAEPEFVPDSLPPSPDFLPRPTDPDHVMSSDNEVAIPRRREARPAGTASGKAPILGSGTGPASVIEFDDTVDLSSGAVDLLDALEKPTGRAPNAGPSDDNDGFLVPLVPATRAAQRQEDGSSPMPLPLPLRKITRKGPPRVRDSYDPATQMPVAPGRARRNVVQPESDEEEEARHEKPSRAAGAAEGSRAKVERRKKVRHGNDWAKTTGLFEIEASEASSDSDPDDPDAGRRRKKKKSKRAGPSSSPSIPSENSDDVRFVARDDSSQSVDQSMHRFYIDSLATQAPALPHDGLGFDRGATRPGAGRWRHARAIHNVTDTPPQLREGEDAAQDDWERGSFVVSDDEISWEEGASGALGAEAGTSEL